MKVFSASKLKSLDHLFNINLINSLSGYKAANLIGTISSEGIENVAVFSSIVHLGSNPPIFGFIVRPTTVPRNTYKNIRETGFYTINHIAKDFIEDAHHTSAKYPEHISEFDKTKLNPEYKHDFLAPYVAESPIQIGMKYLEEYHIKSNDVLLVVGQIEMVFIQDDILEQDGFVDLSKGNIATVNGLDGYAVPINNSRLKYQRPK
jgi:flavin reductase (DIM6/NTAB) family NADH-FMN oxidoreductase RutF